MKTNQPTKPDSAQAILADWKKFDQQRTQATTRINQQTEKMKPADFVGLLMADNTALSEFMARTLALLETQVAAEKVIFPGRN